METLVIIEDLAEKVPFEMDEMDEREAQGALDSLSDDARFYGSDQWLLAETAPRQVKNLIIRAASRHMKNYDGYTQSRAGDETLAWTDRGHEAGSAYFTDSEKRTLRALGGKVGLVSVPIQAWGDRPTGTAFVPVMNIEGKPFPFLMDDGEPW